ncbi:hypothetical protein [Plantibacter sp. YIM 135249]|uniref:hypothetical protein n=1 Tax=Plantibacter sp. YIM 135249 TaxID=3423918 RepID=UPI003D32DFD7
MSPITGDPTAIRSWSRTYGGIADTIVAASEQLQAIQLGEQTSIAIIEYRDNAEYLGTNLGLTEPRYRAVQDALAFYADELEGAQQDEKNAIAAAETADTEHAAANSDYQAKAQVTFGAQANPADPNAAQAKSESDAAWIRLEHARIAREQSQVDIDNAAIRAENAGRTAAAMITTAVDGDGMNDTWWDDWGKAVYDVLTVVGFIVIGIVAIVAIIGLVLATIGTGGLALPPALAAAAAVVGVAGLGIGILQAGMSGIAMASGEKGLENQLTWDLIGLIPFSRFLKGPIAKMLRNMDVPSSGVGSLAGIPRTKNTSPEMDAYLDGMGRAGPTQKAAAQYFLENQIDIFAAISLEAGSAITERSPSALPDLEPNAQAPAAHQEPIPFLGLTGDTQQKPVDEYALVPEVPAFEGSYRVVDGGNGIVQPAPNGLITLPGPFIYPNGNTDPGTPSGDEQ